MSPLTSKLAALDRRVWAAVAVILVLLIAGGGTAGFVEYQQTLPTTVSLNVKSGAKEVKLDQTLTMTFTRPVSAGPVESHFHISPNIDGKLDGGGTKYTWTSNSPWADLTNYTISLDTFSENGHRVQPARWQFTTTIVPRITAVQTSNGSGLSDGGEIPVGTALNIV
ncbi:MAG TPA: Ig-like domain-containing protein, partial [Candidatus Dormibacteraeota bacterium]